MDILGEPEYAEPPVNGVGSMFAGLEADYALGAPPGVGLAPAGPGHVIDGYASLAPDEALAAAQRQARNARLAEQTGYVDSWELSNATAAAKSSGSPMYAEVTLGQAGGNAGYKNSNSAATLEQLNAANTPGGGGGITRGARKGSTYDGFGGSSV